MCVCVRVLALHRWQRRQWEWHSKQKEAAQSAVAGLTAKSKEKSKPPWRPTEKAAPRNAQGRKPRDPNPGPPQPRGSVANANTSVPRDVHNGRMNDAWQNGFDYAEELRGVPQPTERELQRQAAAVAAGINNNT